jgi:hypothetical protein
VGIPPHDKWPKIQGALALGLLFPRLIRTFSATRYRCPLSF